MKIFVRGALTIIVGLICAMWIYGLFFASKQVVNRFEDQVWAKKAQARCLIAAQQRFDLADYRIVDDLGVDAIAKRAAIVAKLPDAALTRKE